MNTLVTRKNVYERKDSDKETQRKNKAIIPVDPIKGNPLLYNCVLEIIFKYMKISELCIFRTVNSIWNEEARNLIAKRNKISLGFGLGENGNEHPRRYRKDLDARELYSKTNLPEYSQILSTFKLGLLNLIMRVNENNPPEDSLFNKKADELTMLINTLPHKLQYLNISCQLLTEQDADRFQTIFGAENLYLLKELKLEIYLDDNSKRLFQNLKPLNALQSVQRVTLNIRWDIKVPNIDQEICNLISNIMFSLLPNVNAIKIETFYRIDDPIYVITQFNTPLTNVFCHQLKNRAHLKKLSLPLNEEYLEPTELICSKEFLPCLTRLDIRLNIIDNSTDIIRLFDRYAKSIQELSIMFFVKEPGRNILLEVDVPIFPKIRKLAINYETFHSNYSGIKLDFWFRFINDELDYKVQFPLLEELSLGTNNFWGNPVFRSYKKRIFLYCNPWKFYEQFLPSPNLDEIMTEQLKFLYVPFYGSMMNAPTEIPLHQLMDRLNKIFPNIEKSIIHEYVENIPWYIKRMNKDFPKTYYTKKLNKVVWHSFTK